MLPIKYVGPRPVISQHGISYKNGKEDKYTYLLVAIEILKDISHNNEEKKSYTHLVDTKPLTVKQINQFLSHYEDELYEHVNNQKNEYEKQILQEIQNVQNLDNLSQDDKNAWIENIKIMKEYRIQRAINKIYYLHCIEDIKKIIKKEHIKEIDTPFNEKFWHVLETLQGALETGKNSVATKLEETNNEDGDMIMKLYINVPKEASL